MPTKTPKAYQVEGYSETIDSVTALSKLKWPNKESILTNFLAEEDVVWVRGEARAKRQEYIADKKTLSKLKIEKSNGEMPELQLQMLAELKSKLEVWVTPIIFEWRIQDELTGTMNEWKINYNGKDYTFVREEWVAESFGWMKNVRDFSDKNKSFEENREDATVYLKELFADYADQYPRVFSRTNRYNVDSGEMFPMINKWVQDNQIPYAGWQSSDGDRSWADLMMYAWLPVRVRGEFACVWSYSDDDEANFGRGGKGEARLSVSFQN